MALNVTGNFELETGQVLTQVYARTNAALSIDGARVVAYPEFWISEPAFTNRKDSLRLNIMGDFTYAYNRETDGTDILTFANTKAAETLEGLGYTVEIVEIEA
jgi:hypothetical protein